MKNSKKYYVTTFYKFKPITNLDDLKSDLINKALELDIRGLVIIGHEGLNSTVSSSNKDGLINFKKWIQNFVEDPTLFFKDSSSHKNPFRRFMVKIRDEIVTLGTPDLVPTNSQNHHLSPTEWNKVLKEEKDVLLVDTRNWYETKIGTFKGAVNPLIDKFTEFPEYMNKHNIPKNKKMLIFCTGGIRCEKGILELQRQGFNNVYQLNGGIINYLKEYPNDQFEGECFVFDHRVALDQNLEPSQKYGLCPHCGQPSHVSITCKRCDTESLICSDCEKLDWKKDTCSKNCAYQYRLHPERKGHHQILPFELENRESN